MTIAQPTSRANHRPWAPGLAIATLAVSLGAQRPGPGIDWVVLESLAADATRWLEQWYRTTPPGARVAWGGLFLCALAGFFVTIGRSWRLRSGRIVPPAFRERFQKRLAAGHIDIAKGIDYCELNPSPAARVALAALQRGERPQGDQERGCALAQQREVDDLRRHLGTLRRIVGLAPLLGLLGTLSTAAASLSAPTTGFEIGPALAGALAPLTAGVVLAILTLVAYDGLASRVEWLGGLLDRIGAETIDAIALADPSPRTGTTGPRRDLPATPEGPEPPRAPHWVNKR